MQSALLVLRQCAVPTVLNFLLRCSPRESASLSEQPTSTTRNVTDACDKLELRCDERVGRGGAAAAAAAEGSAASA